MVPQKPLNDEGTLFPDVPGTILSWIMVHGLLRRVAAEGVLATCKERGNKVPAPCCLGAYPNFQLTQAP